jgi:hypothetical protein
MLQSFCTGRTSLPFRCQIDGRGYWVSPRCKPNDLCARGSFRTPLPAMVVASLCSHTHRGYVTVDVIVRDCRLNGQRLKVEKLLYKPECKGTPYFSTEKIRGNIFFFLLNSMPFNSVDCKEKEVNSILLRNNKFKM